MNSASISLLMAANFSARSSSGIYFIRPILLKHLHAGDLVEGHVGVQSVLPLPIPGQDGLEHAVLLLGGGIGIDLMESVLVEIVLADGAAHSSVSLSL